MAPTDLDQHRGELVGIAGLRGSGRTELARLLAGGERADTGQAEVAGDAVSLRSSTAAMRQRIAMASEDRIREGVSEGMSVRVNISQYSQSLRGETRAPSRPRTK